MNSTRSTLFAITAALAASPAAHAATSNVDFYGVFSQNPTSGVHSAAADIGTNLFSGTAFAPTVSVTETSAQTAAIALTNYSAQAKTTLGNNHAYAHSNGFYNGAFGVNSFSGWYDQVTITGGTGTGTVQFSMQMNGVVTAGAYLGMVGYGLIASSVHPTQLTSDTLAFNVLNTVPWALDSSQVTPIALYDIVASPYSDPDEIISLLNPAPPTGPEGIPSITGTDPSNQLGEDMGFPEYVPDLILAPGANQIVNVTLTGTLTFTYGEAFYLIGALGSGILDTVLFEPFGISENPTPPPPDGTGPTTLDFFNSAHLTTVALPQGASLASASGAAYNVTAVPEPGEWLLMLAGLGLVGWRVRRRA